MHSVARWTETEQTASAGVIELRLAMLQGSVKLILSGDAIQIDLRFWSLDEPGA
jgi:hypothetical protein